jgi:hypothetical protein
MDAASKDNYGRKQAAIHLVEATAVRGQLDGQNRSIPR